MYAFTFNLLPASLHSDISLDIQGVYTYIIFTTLLVNKNFTKRHRHIVCASSAGGTLKVCSERYTHSTCAPLVIQGCPKNFRTESKKYTLTIMNIRSKATQRIMAENFTRLTHKIAMKLHLVADSCTICNSRFRRPVRKLLDTPSYLQYRSNIRAPSMHATVYQRRLLQ